MDHFGGFKIKKSVSEAEVLDLIREKFETIEHSTVYWSMKALNGKWINAKMVKLMRYAIAIEEIGFYIDVSLVHTLIKNLHRQTIRQRLTLLGDKHFLDRDHNTKGASISWRLSDEFRDEYY